MENRAALFFILCLNLTNHICAAFSRNNGGEQLLTASVNQPPRLEVDAATGQVSLLEIVKGLQRRPTLAAVTSEVQTERRDLSGQSAHERLLLSDMGRLEDELETWKNAEKKLEHQMAQQTATVESMKAEQRKAIHDEEMAAMVWWDCKMLMCLLLVAGVGFCVYTTSSSKTPSFNAAEPAQVTARKVRAQPEFIEKDAKPEAEDLLMFSQPHPTENSDLEAAVESRPAQEKWQLDMGCWQLELPSNDKKTVETPGQCDNGDRSCCQYFALNKTSEDPVEVMETPQTVTVSPRSPEEAWWAESTSAY